MYGQTINVVFESGNSDFCKYDLMVNGNLLTKNDDCTFEIPFLTAGETYELEIINSTNSSGANLSTFDLVLLAQLILDINQTPLGPYLGDIDQDGAVSTYDLLKLRDINIFKDFTEDIFHVINAKMEIPVIDKFDIQVDYRKLIFTSDDFDNNILEVKVLQLGNMDEF